MSGAGRKRSRRRPSRPQVPSRPEIPKPPDPPPPAPEGSTLREYLIRARDKAENLDRLVSRQKQELRETEAQLMKAIGAFEFLQEMEKQGGIKDNSPAPDAPAGGEDETPEAETPLEDENGSQEPGDDEGDEDTDPGEEGSQEPDRGSQEPGEVETPGEDETE